MSARRPDADGRSNLLRAVGHASLAALEAPFRAAVAWRRIAYDAGWREVVRLPVAVISIGNLAVGGTGKTPFSILLASRLLEAGRSPGIVARGYRRERGQRLNDEGREVERAFAGRVPQVQDPDRVAAAHALLAAHPETDVLLLDDGFQHRRVARDLDIVLLDGTRDLDKDHLLPRGRLREPPAALERADLVVVTRAERLDPAARLARSLAIARHTHAPVAFAATHPVRVEGLADSDVAALFGLRVALVSGIGAPDAFRATVETLGAEVVWAETWPDHRAPGPERLDALRRRASATGARALLVTRKDAMKLGAAMERPGPVPVGVLVVATDLVDGCEQLDRAVRRALGGAPSRA